MADSPRLVRPRVVHELRPLAQALRTRWTHAFLRDAHPASPVEVSVSQNGVVDGSLNAHETIAMTFAQFMQQLDSSWRARPSALRYHLAQCPLVTLSTLQADVPRPPSTGGVKIPTSALAHLWLCIGGGRSSLHYDEFDGVLLVVRGRKSITLLPPSASRLVKPRAAHLLSANHTRLQDAELDAMLEAGGEAAAAAGAVCLVARAGEAVAIPQGWWHRVDSSGEPGEEVTLAINWWWRAGSPTLPPSSAPAEDEPATRPSVTSYELRSAFAAATREEERRRLQEAAGLDAAAMAHLLDDELAENGGGTKCECECTADEVMATSKSTPAAGGDGTAATAISSLARDLLAQQPADGSVFDSSAEDDRRLLSLIVTQPAPLLLAALSFAADDNPNGLRTLLSHGLGAAGAFALGRKLQAAQAAGGSLAARRLEHAFSCVGDEAAQHAARERLLMLEERFSDAAAARVLTETLGLDEAMIARLGAREGETGAAPAGHAHDGKRKRAEQYQ